MSSSAFQPLVLHRNSRPFHVTLLSTHTPYHHEIKFLLCSFLSRFKLQPERPFLNNSMCFFHRHPQELRETRKLEHICNPYDIIRMEFIESMQEVKNSSYLPVKNMVVSPDIITSIRELDNIGVIATG